MAQARTTGPIAFAFVALGLCASVTGSTTDQAPEAHQRQLASKTERFAFIRRAQVWSPTPVAEMDLRVGPPGPEAFAPGETVTCDYVSADLAGATPKFSCATPEGDTLKIKYGPNNGEVQASVLASRLLWALGFGADRVYPVRVVCRGCSPDPWTNRSRAPGERVFDPAIVERKPAGEEMKHKGKSGWAWPELNIIDESQGGATRAQRDGLTLLAVFIQHTDSKPQQERLVCVPGGTGADGRCERPFMMLHDVGMTFGHANLLNRAKTGSASFEQWAKTPIWRDEIACVGHISRSMTGTLGDPTISEAGRQFLADLLNQLSDRQLRDLFEVARVNLRSRRPGSDEPPATVDEWVSAFKQKRDQISAAHCPS